MSDNSAECVVCLSDVRDTLILPCRHLCLCNTCADTLRYQANNCPICRLPFRALLQIRAMRKKLGPLSPTSFNPIISSQTSDSEEHSVSWARNHGPSEANASLAFLNLSCFSMWHCSKELDLGMLQYLAAQLRACVTTKLLLWKIEYRS